MLGDFGDEMDQTSSRMDSVLKKLEKVSHMTSSTFTHTQNISNGRQTVRCFKVVYISAVLITD